MRKPWVPNSKSVISLKICPCIHPFFLLYWIQGHFDYRAIVLPKVHIVPWPESVASLEGVEGLLHWITIGKLHQAVVSVKWRFWLSIQLYSLTAYTHRNKFMERIGVWLCDELSLQILHLSISEVFALALCLNMKDVGFTWLGAWRETKCKDNPKAKAQKPG